MTSFKNINVWGWALGNKFWDGSLPTESLLRRIRCSVENGKWSLGIKGKHDCTEGDELWRRCKTGPGSRAFAPRLGRPLISPTLGQGVSWVGWRQRVFGETRAVAMLMSLPLILNPWHLWAQPFFPSCPPPLPVQGSHFHLPKSLPSAAITSPPHPASISPQKCSFLTPPTCPGTRNRSAGNRNTPLGVIKKKATSK